FGSGLMASLPRLDTDLRRLEPIPGQPPSLLRVPPGCPFHPRCRLRHDRDRCVTEVPPLLDVDSRGQHTSACHFWPEMPGEVDTVGERIGVELQVGRA
ncbi:MAG: hypothetical protein KY450_12330, partial [Actinobacteria bacterium]|nr:hypothetical protein [Actinomycetota bacterium]